MPQDASIEELIPWLYLKSVSTADFGDALAALMDPDRRGLSATTVTRLRQTREDDFRGVVATRSVGPAARLLMIVAGRREALW